MGNGLTERKFARRKIIRYIRWVIKLAFLAFFVSPFIYLAGAPNHYVYSIFVGDLHQPLLALPYGQSPCALWTYAYGQIGPGAWLVDPFGGIQTLITGQVNWSHFLPVVGAVLLFLVPMFLLGNVFCGWVCPLGTLIDGFDKAVASFLRRTEVRREERLRRSKEKDATRKASALSGSLCPACPLSKFLGNRFGGTAANGILITSLAGSAVFRFPVFCAVCPIGITTRGMFNLKAWTYLTGTMMPIILELFAIPVIAVLVSLREKRFWCRKLCPVGATLNFAGSFSPILKPKLQADRCVMKECPKTCEDYHLDYCSACRIEDDKECEKACPQGINLLDGGSLAKCTKCMECYITCDKKAIRVEAIGQSEGLSVLKRLFKRKIKAKNSATQN